MQAPHLAGHYGPYQKFDRYEMMQAGQAARGATPASAGQIGRAVVDQFELSNEANELIQMTEADTEQRAGKSAQSPAWQARLAIADHPELATMPFGHVVSAVARGALDSLLAPVEPPVEPPVDPPIESAGQTAGEEAGELPIEEASVTDAPATEGDSASGTALDGAVPVSALAPFDPNEALVEAGEQTAPADGENTTAVSEESFVAEAEAGTAPELPALEPEGETALEEILLEELDATDAPANEEATVASAVESA